jgi:hypothetical protein
MAEVEEKTKLSDLTSHQWKSGIAAWLGWLFDGLDMHLYVLVATPFIQRIQKIPKLVTADRGYKPRF